MLNIVHQHARPSPAGLNLTPEARNAPESGIVEVMNYGRNKQGLIPLWVGEGDLPTPDFICETAAASLKKGETFYTWQRGVPELRAALAHYHTQVYGTAGGQDFTAEQFFVTGSGMQSVQIAVRMISGPGDELIIPTPAWPNFAAAIGVAGAKPVCVPMQLANGVFTLDLEAMAAAVTPRTKALVINTPSNPTGWTARRDELEALLALARQHGLWIIADEIYGRFVYDGSARAPSFHDIMDPEDKILFVQTFSKNWAMTGWRVGWIEANPALGPELGQVIENMIQYSTSGSPVFLQRGAVAALGQGEDFIAAQIARASEGRRIVHEGLMATGKVRMAAPAGAFYAFFTVDGQPDARKLAMHLVDHANVGLAPGTAFGPGGETGLRLCYARSRDDVVEATARIAAAISAM